MLQNRVGTGWRQPGDVAVVGTNATELGGRDGWGRHDAACGQAEATYRGLAGCAIRERVAHPAGSLCDFTVQRYHWPAWPRWKMAAKPCIPVTGGVLLRQDVAITTFLLVLSASPLL